MRRFFNASKYVRTVGRIAYICTIYASHVLVKTFLFFLLYCETKFTLKEICHLTLFHLLDDVAVYNLLLNKSSIFQISLVSDLNPRRICSQDLLGYNIDFNRNIQICSEFDIK